MWPLAIYPSMMACWPAESLSFTLGVLAFSSHRYLKSSSPQMPAQDNETIAGIFPGKVIIVESGKSAKAHQPTSSSLADRDLTIPGGCGGEIPPRYSTLASMGIKKLISVPLPCLLKTLSRAPIIRSGSSIATSQIPYPLFL